MLIAIIVAIALVVGAIALNLRRDFEQYLTENEVASLDELVDALVSHPQAQDGWSALRTKDAWARFASPLLHSGPSPRDMTPPPAPAPAPPNGSPPPPGPFEIIGRLVLRDADDALVAGRPEAGEITASRPLAAADGTPLGTLQLQARAEIASPADRAFLGRQLRSLAVVSLVAIAFGMVVAALLARHLLQPIHMIGAHVARLAAGDLSSRIKARREDELGRMMRDHNALARSLEAARTRERRWVSDTSHELKTPLSVLQAEVEAMQDGVRPLDQRTLAGLHASVMRLARLAEDLGTLASGDEATLISRREPVDLGALAKEASDAMREPMRRAGLVLDTDLSPGVVICGDHDRLRQLLDNLLENARRYTDAPGRILVRCRAEDGTARLTVSDTAPCPPPDMLDGLFERFVRAEDSRARAHGGAGLGLAICRAIAQAHGGTIRAAPASAGGLRATFALPLINKDDPADA